MTARHAAHVWPAWSPRHSSRRPGWSGCPRPGRGRLVLGQRASTSSSTSTRLGGGVQKGCDPGRGADKAGGRSSRRAGFTLTLRPATARFVARSRPPERDACVQHAPATPTGACSGPTASRAGGTTRPAGRRRARGPERRVRGLLLAEQRGAKTPAGRPRPGRHPPRPTPAPKPDPEADAGGATPKPAPTRRRDAGADGGGAASTAAGTADPQRVRAGAQARASAGASRQRVGDGHVPPPAPRRVPRDRVGLREPVLDPGADRRRQPAATSRAGQRRPRARPTSTAACPPGCPSR